MQEVATTFGINGKLLLIQVINFGVLLWLLRHFLYQPLIRMMNERSQKIEKGINDAKLAGAELLDATEKKEEIIKAAKEESKAILGNAIQTAEKIRDNIQKEAETKAKEMIAAAVSQAEDEKRKMMMEVKGEVLALAVEITEKILGEQVNELRDKNYIARITERITK